MSASLAAALSPARAHDFWLEPSTHRAAPGETISVRLLVGEHYRGEAVPRNPARIERFWSRDGAGDREVAGAAGAEPAGRLEVRAAGTTWIAYDGLPARLELGAAAFERYLTEEGLERIVEIRRARGEGDRPGRELYSRCAKSLLTVDGAAPPGELARPLGLELELLLESTSLDPGGSNLQVLYRGVPLSAIRVLARSRAHPELVAEGRTDADGRVRLDLDRPGIWMVKAVHMIERDARLAGVDWESLWASLTFELTAPIAAAPAPDRTASR